METIVIDAKRLPWPTSWTAVYGRAAPLILEIGFGGGHFLVDLGKKRPSANVLGIEIASPSLQKGVKKVRAAGVENVRIAQSDGTYVLWALCKTAVVDEIYINFPDPWRKEKHYHRRLISDRFLQLAASRMKRGGLLSIATDHADYAEWITERLERTPYFDSRLPTTFVTEDRERLRTKYEKTALQEGRVCQYYKWKRNETAVADTFPPPKEYEMPHVVLKSRLTVDEIGRRFQTMRFADGDGETQVKFLESYKSLRHESLLVETFINETLMQQRAALAVRQRADERIVINLHEMGFPRPTEGVKTAVAHLARWVVGLDADTEILRSNVGLEAD